MIKLLTFFVILSLSIVTLHSWWVLFHYVNYLELCHDCNFTSSDAPWQLLLHSFIGNLAYYHGLQSPFPIICFLQYVSVMLITVSRWLVVSYFEHFFLHVLLEYKLLENNVLSLLFSVLFSGLRKVPDNKSQIWVSLRTKQTNKNLTKF